MRGENTDQLHNETLDAKRLKVQRLQTPFIPGPIIPSFLNLCSSENRSATPNPFRNTCKGFQEPLKSTCHVALWPNAGIRTIRLECWFQISDPNRRKQTRAIQTWPCYNVFQELLENTHQFVSDFRVPNVKLKYNCCLKLLLRIQVVPKSKVH